MTRIAKKIKIVSCGPNRGQLREIDGIFTHKAVFLFYFYIECLENTIHWLGDDGQFYGCIHGPNPASDYDDGLQVCSDNVDNHGQPVYYLTLDTEDKYNSFIGFMR